jgi:DNA-binding Lrp family transcriptional regulator
MSIISLSERERRIIAAVGGRADLQSTELARIAQVPLQQFHRSLDRLITEGVLRKLWIIDPARLGLLRFAIYFSLRPRKVSLKQQILKGLIAAPQVVMLQEIGGEFEFEMTVLARSPLALIDFLFSLPADHSAAFVNKSVATRRSLRFYPRKYLSSRNKHAPGLVVGGELISSSVDALDDRVLTALDSNPLASRRAIARLLGLPDSTADLRIRKLMKDRVIVGATYSTSPALYGATTYKLLLFARGYSTEFRERLSKFAEAHPNVTFLIDGFGDWDYELGIEVEESQQLIAVREAVSTEFGSSLHAIKVVTRFRVLKQRGYLTNVERAQIPNRD